jgi:hypothetical protein
VAVTPTPKEKDLFGVASEIETPIEVELFGDEIKNSVNTETKERWHYIGLLALPTSRKPGLLERLLPCRGDCDSEIKASDLGHSPKRRTAERWLDVLLKDHQHRSIFVSIVGLNVSLLNKAAFGGDRFDHIYNRFFRTCIASGCKRFFGQSRVHVGQVWHDEGDLEHDDYFPWHSIFKLKDEQSLTFATNEIAFISSDHRDVRGCPESHLIQFLDLFMGLTKQLLDDTSRKAPHCDTARILCPLVQRMMNAPFNPNSRYGYMNKYVISFFPSRPLTDEEIADPVQRATSRFYTSRPLLQIERESGQEYLFGSSH